MQPWLRGNVAVPDPGEVGAISTAVLDSGAHISVPEPGIGRPEQRPLGGRIEQGFHDT